MPTSQLRSLIQSNEKGKVYKSLYENLVERLSIKDSVLSIKDSLITEYKTQNALQIAQDLIRKSQIANLEQQLTIKSKDIRRQKRKTFIVAAIGTLLTGTITYLSITH